jgi:hypothetical protein
LIGVLDQQGANLAVRSGRQAVDEGLARLGDRGVLVVDGPRIRVRNRIVLRFYARTIEHLLRRGRTTH